MQESMPQKKPVEQTKSMPMNKPVKMNKPVNIYSCYAHRDIKLAEELQLHLRSLQKKDHINWYDRDISVGTDWEYEIDRHLDTAHIILLLVSPDFLDSDYCYSIEMKMVMGKHERGEARVIPIILRPVYWERTLFGKLQVLPTNAKPVTSWTNRREAFSYVAESISKVVRELRV